MSLENLKLRCCQLKSTLSTKIDLKFLYTPVTENNIHDCAKWLEIYGSSIRVEDDELIRYRGDNENVTVNVGQMLVMDKTNKIFPMCKITFDYLFEEAHYG